MKFKIKKVDGGYVSLIKESFLSGWKRLYCDSLNQKWRISDKTDISKPICTDLAQAESNIIRYIRINEHGQWDKQAKHEHQKDLQSRVNGWSKGAL